MNERIRRIRTLLKEKTVDGILVTNSKNIFYLSGFRGVCPEDREALLVVTMRRTILIVPEMYMSDANKLITVKNGSVQARSIDQKKGFYGTALSLFGKPKKKVIIESRNLSIFEYDHIKKGKMQVLISYPTLCEEVRICKEAAEVRVLQKAAKITDHVFKRVVQYLRRNDYTKITEQELADKMSQWGKDGGADEWAFAPIIASGSGSALPHYHTGQKTLKKNAPLLMDFGFCVDGYNSDMSRTIFLGKASENFRKHYDLVKNVQDSCVKKVCPGVETTDLDQSARTYFEKEDVEKYFIHSLGHGLGLDVHEAPFVGSKNGTILREGMIITIEPGIYFPRKYGIRIEDDIVVTKNGYKIMNKSPKELIEI